MSQPKAKKSTGITLPLNYKEIPGTGDFKVFNFALTLEYVETDLYAQAIQRLTTGGTNSIGTTIPGLGLTTSDTDVAIINEFAQVEFTHRDFLKSVLGAQAVQPFQYNFGIENMSRAQVIQLLLTSETNGLGAYLGGAGLLTSTANISIAGAITGVEGRHAAVLAELSNILFNAGLIVAPLNYENEGRDLPRTPDEALAVVNPFIVSTTTATPG